MLEASTLTQKSSKKILPTNPDTSIIHHLEMCLKSTPHKTLYSFANTENATTTDISYATLSHDALNLLHHLQTLGLQKTDRVILILPQDYGFIKSFFACLYGGFIAVPTYPPRLSSTPTQLINQLKDCKPKAIITTQKYLSIINAIKHPLSQVLNLDTFIITSKTASWNPNSIQNSDIAFLQYTSGSTSSPKGVTLTHQNIIKTQKMIQTGVSHPQKNLCVVGWMPFYHDMGLIGNILQPLYCQGTCILTSPSNVVRSPFHWLSLISTHKASTSGGPNFIYDLCVEHITKKQKQTLDLSQWNVAFTGAEPIKAHTLDAFSETFKDCGFKKSSFYPCYGMAEATLMISGTTVNAEPKTKNNHVSCGKAILNTKIKIVDPVHHNLLPANQTGEIWVQGPQIAQGYWNKEKESNETFQAHIKNTNEGPFLRTGDLGFMDENNDLYITSRLKDLIILNGKNFAPQDIESVVTDSHPGLLANSCACFSTTNQHDQERLVIVAELNRHYLKRPDFSDILQSIQKNINEEFIISAENIILIKPHSIPKTSSGKIQRQRCKQQYETSQLKEIASSQKPTLKTQDKDPKSEIKVLQKILNEQNIQVGTQNLETLELSQLGLDSLQRQQLHLNIENRLSTKIDDQFFFQKKPLLELLRDLKLNNHQQGTHSKNTQIQTFFKWANQLKKKGLSLQDARTNAPSPKIAFQNKETTYLNFSSYNYLGFSTHPKVIQHAKDALDQYGLSASSSPLAGGYLACHEKLENDLLNFYNFNHETHGVVLFNSGFSTNTGSISALVDSNDVIIYDENSHASIVEGAKLSGAKTLLFHHNNTDHLESVLKSIDSTLNILVCVESIYSTTGDTAPLKKICDISKKHRAKLLVDEAHSALISGKHGQGLCEEAGILHDVDYIVLTFSKAFGSIGGALIAPKSAAEFVLFHAKSRMFSCGLDPAVTAGTQTSIQLAQTTEGKELRKKIKDNARYLRTLLAPHFNIEINNNWIIPIIFGSEKKAIKVKLFLNKNKLYAGLLQYPAVPKNKAMIRLFVSAQHNKKDLQKAAKIIIELKNNI